MQRNNIINKFRKNIKNKILPGFWFQLSGENSVNLISNLNYDWYVFDMEHGAYDFSNLPVVINILKSKNKIVLVRLTESTPINCRLALDAGADGVILPNISDPIILKTCISSCYYPPKGKRGVGYSNSNGYGKLLKKILKSNFKPFIVAQIEDAKSGKYLDEILSNKFLDAAFIGPYDLSASLKDPGNFNSSKYKKFLENFLKLGKQYGLNLGYHFLDPSNAKLLNKINKQGFNLIAYSTDGQLINFFFENPVNN